MGWFLRHPLPRSLPPGLHALVYSHPLKWSRIYDLPLNTVKYSKSDRMPLLWSCSYMSPFCWPPCLRDSSCGLCEVHGQVGESHVARNCRRPLEFWIASRSWGHLTPPVSTKQMRSVLQLQGSEFCPQIESLEAEPFVVKPLVENSALADGDDSLWAPKYGNQLIKFLDS